MITPAYLDLTIYQGATFDQTVTMEVDGSAWNLTGYTAQLLAKHRDDDLPAITLTHTAGLTLGNGTVVIAMTATETAAITANRYPYQLEVTSGGTTTRALEGTIRVIPEITE